MGLQNTNSKKAEVHYTSFCKNRLGSISQHKVIFQELALEIGGKTPKVSAV
jgi:hypothetical protein